VPGDGVEFLTGPASLSDYHAVLVGLKPEGGEAIYSYRNGLLSMVLDTSGPIQSFSKVGKMPAPRGCPREIQHASPPAPASPAPAVATRAGFVADWKPGHGRGRAGGFVRQESG